MAVTWEHVEVTGVSWVQYAIYQQSLITR